MKPFRYLQQGLIRWAAAGMLIGLSACAAPPILDATYVLKPQQSLALSRGLTLSYDSVSDSRCPANVHCIWAGRLAYRFIVRDRNGSEEFSLGPDQPVAAPAALHGGHVSLELSAVPPARIATARPSDLTPVTLRITAK